MNFYNNFAVDVFLLNGDFVGNWPNKFRAAEALGIRNPGNIDKCLRGQIKYLQGYVWKLHPTLVELLPDEEWKLVQGHEDSYAVSNKGRVASLRSHGKESFTILKGSSGAHGYRKVNLYNSNTKKSKNYLVHRLVAEAFLLNEDQKEQVDHIDTDILNNCVENLRWVTSIENHHNPLTLERHKRNAKDMASKYGNNAAMEVKRVPVKQVLNGIETFYSCYLDAAKKTGHSDSAIAKWCKTGKYGWSKA